MDSFRPTERPTAAAQRSFWAAASGAPIQSLFTLPPLSLSIPCNRERGYCHLNQPRAPRTQAEVRALPQPDSVMSGTQPPPLGFADNNLGTRERQLRVKRPFPTHPARVPDRRASERTMQQRRIESVRDRRSRRKGKGSRRRRHKGRRH